MQSFFEPKWSPTCNPELSNTSRNWYHVNTPPPLSLDTSLDQSLEMAVAFAAGADNPAIVASDSLPTSLVEVDGLLLRADHDDVDSYRVPLPLVPTDTTTHNLGSLATAVCQHAPVLVTGQTGCGKSSLVAELARKCGKASTLLTLHMGDQVGEEDEFPYLTSYEMNFKI